MTEIAKECNYREVLEVLSGLGIKSHNKIQMFDGRALEAQVYLEEKLRDDNNLSVSTDKIIPDYWIISGQVFKNKEDYVKQQIGFNPDDIRENWEASFEHFAIPVYRDPFFMSEYEKGIEASFVRQNKLLKERCDRYEKALIEISNGTAVVSIDDFNASLKLSVESIYAEQVLAAIEKGEKNEI